jgi:hypothetical protein
VRALRTSHLVRLFVERARFPVVEVTAHDDEQRVRYVDLRATGDGRTQTRFALVVRLNAAGDVQAVEFLNRLLLPTSPERPTSAVGFSSVSAPPGSIVEAHGASRATDGG